MRRVTGEVSLARGIYHSDCRCNAELRVRVGERFPECPTCRRPVAWLFTRSVLVDGPPPGREPERRP